MRWPGASEVAEIETHYERFDYKEHGAGIREFVEQVDGDREVLGTRGRTNLRDILLGGTAERMVRAPCSLLAVKPEGFTFLGWNR